MKKCMVLICLVVFLFPGCGKEPIIRQNDSDLLILAHSFSDLIDVSDLIIKAKVLPGKKNVPDTEEVGGHTITKLQVLETFKGDVVPDEILTITEEYYQDKDVIWTVGNYLPANENQEYIFFLTKYGANSNWSGMYFVTDLARGKYSLKSSILDNLDTLDSLSNSDLEIWIEPDDEYREWYKQVIEKYCPNN